MIAIAGGVALGLVLLHVGCWVACLLMQAIGALFEPVLEPSTPAPTAADIERQREEYSAWLLAKYGHPKG